MLVGTLQQTVMARAAQLPGKKKKKGLGEARFFSNNRAASSSHVMGHNR